MGRIYKPIEVSYNGTKRITVGLVDSGADETVVSGKLADVNDGGVDVILGIDFIQETKLEIRP